MNKEFENFVLSNANEIVITHVCQFGGMALYFNATFRGSDFSFTRHLQIVHYTHEGTLRDKDRNDIYTFNKKIAKKIFGILLCRFQAENSAKQERAINKVMKKPSLTIIRGGK